MREPSVTTMISTVSLELLDAIIRGPVVKHRLEMVDICELEEHSIGQPIFPATKNFFYRENWIQASPTVGV